MNRIRSIVAALALAAGLGLLMAGPADATEGTDGPVYVDSSCDAVADWQVAHDEADNLPEATAAGLLLDGPKFAYHAAPAGLTLAELEAGSFVADVTQGNAPLFKVLTDPFSTLNLAAADGNLWWSSRIAPGDQGGQNHPVTPAVMATLPIIDKTWDDATAYTAATAVTFFGVGYGNDTGNKAVVSSVAFAGKTYPLKPAEACKIVDDPDSPSPSPEATVPPTHAPTTPPAVLPSELPLTGPGDGVNPLAILLPIAAGLLMAGAAIVLMVRRRRDTPTFRAE